MIATHRWTAGAAGAVTLGVCAAVFAQGAPSRPGTTADSSARAANLAREGRALIAKGQVEEGCSKLSESVRESPRSSVAMEAASCLEKQEKRALAYLALDDAIAAAKQERSATMEATARKRQKALEPRVAWLTLSGAPANVTLELDGSEFVPASDGSALAIEPGEHAVTARSPGKQDWKWSEVLKPGQRVSVSIPALEDVPPEAPAVPPKAELAQEPRTKRTGAPYAERAGRLVIELGALGGVIAAGELATETSAVDGLPYSFPGASGGTIFAACGDRVTVSGAGTCSGQFASSTSGAIGAQAFVGWAFTPRLHAGVRAMGLGSLSRGFLVGGGPALSARAFGPLWLGLGATVGYESHRALLVSASGSAPIAAGAVDVPLGGATGEAVDVSSGVVVGGTAELVVALFGAEHPGATSVRTRSGFLSGSLLAGLWPSVLVGGGASVISIPGGLSYRFH